MDSGDRVAVADAPFPRSFRGRGTAASAAHTLPFVYAFASTHQGTAEPAAGNTSLVTQPEAFEVGAHNVSYFEVTIEQAPDDSVGWAKYVAALRCVACHV